MNLIESICELDDANVWDGSLSINYSGDLFAKICFPGWFGAWFAPETERLKKEQESVRLQ